MVSTESNTFRRKLPTKESFVKHFTSDEYKDYDTQVVTFIANIIYDKRNDECSLTQFFSSGYCYYFATMLKTAFNRGKLCLTEPIAHIVWVDDNGLAYDVNGPYLPSNHDCECLTDVDFLEDTIFDFMHVQGKEYHAPSDLHDWAEFMHMSDVYAVTRIYLDMPKEEVDYTSTITDVVYLYWIQHKQELQEQYWHLRKGGNSYE